MLRAEKRRKYVCEMGEKMTENLPKQNFKATNVAHGMVTQSNGGIDIVSETMYKTATSISK